ncbi:hypothetical protein QT381_10855 [Galbitalea sp. SE-J8]|uniref:hypothetical protein n=1 Tax=Galbitalea sp. SE-J8 TaxID=3054952 RepID=UPI00259CCF53|nr:hypothetical protein [Galbitalea sp. SE-J8]MDM4763509.1 hypothetical protein [Galbitalea sp. SE-J8]
MKKTTIVMFAGLVVAASVSLAGCAGQADGSNSVALPAASPDVTETAVSTAIAGDYSLCTSLLDAKTVETYRGYGWTAWGSEFEKKIVAESSDVPTSVARFVKRGGVICAWGLENDEAGVLFAYGPISAQDAEAEKKSLIEQGSKPVDAAFERYTHPDGYDGGYAFGDGYWAYVLDNGGGDVLSQLVANAHRF